MTEAANSKTGSIKPADPMVTIRTLKIRLQILLLLVTLPAIIIIALMGVQERNNVMVAYQDEARRVTKQLVQRQARQTEEIRSFLTELSLSPAVFSPSDPSCRDFLAKVLPLKPQYAGIAVPWANGDLSCSTSALSKGISISGSPYIQRALDEEVFSVGTYQFDEAAKIIGFSFAYPIQTPSDNTKLTSAAVVVSSLDWWSEALAEEGLPEDTVALITDNAGQVVATFPNPAKLLGHKVTEIGFTDGMFKDGVGELFNHPDGVRRVFIQQTFFSSPDLGRVQMSLGIPVDAGLSAVTRQVAVQLSIFGGVLILSWLTAMHLLDRGVIGPLSLLNREQLSLGHKRGEVAAFNPGGVDQISDFDLTTQSSQNALENARKKQENHLQALLEATSDNYFHFDKEGRIIDYRLQLEKSWFKDRIDRYGHVFADILPPAMGQKFKKEFRRFHEKKGLVTWTNKLDLDGVRHFREYRLCPISGSDESVLLVRDASKLHLAEEQRDQSEARFQRIIANLPGVVVSRRITDTDNVEVTYISPQCKDIWGLTEEEIYADVKVLEATAIPEDLHKMAKLAAQAADDHKPYTYRFKIVLGSGETKWLETNTSAYHQEDGSILTDGILIDVTAEIEVQQQLEKERSVSLHAQKLESIGQMTGGVAHDFNNILAAIMGSLELLRDDLSEEEHLTLIDVGIGAARRGSELTGAMLAYARRGRLEPKIIDLNRMVLETRKWSGRVLPSGIQFETSLVTGLWPTKADISSTESALLNLILNARDAMPDGGLLRIETENVEVGENCMDASEEQIEPGRYVVLAVSDTGTGVSEKTLSKIFEPFFTTRPVGSGSGLGLPMTMGFMRQSGGTVKAISQLGVGSTIKLFFRAADEEEGWGEATPRAEKTTE